MSEQESNKGKYPVKTAVGVGLLLLYLFHGKGGLGLGKGKPVGFAKLGLMPQELQNLLDFSGNVPTDTISLILTPNGLSKLPQTASSAMDLSALVKYKTWFTDGKLKLSIAVRGDTIQGDVEKLKGELSRLGLPVWMG